MFKFLLVTNLFVIHLTFASTPDELLKSSGAGEVPNAEYPGGSDEVFNSPRYSKSLNQFLNEVILGSKNYLYPNNVGFDRDYKNKNPFIENFLRKLLVYGDQLISARLAAEDNTGGEMHFVEREMIKPDLQMKESAIDVILPSKNNMFTDIKKHYIPEELKKIPVVVVSDPDDTETRSEEKSTFGSNYNYNRKRRSMVHPSYLKSNLVGVIPNLLTSLGSVALDLSAIPAVITFSLFNGTSPLGTGGTPAAADAAAGRKKRDSEVLGNLREKRNVAIDMTQETREKRDGVEAYEDSREKRKALPLEDQPENKYGFPNFPQKYRFSREVEKRGGKLSGLIDGILSNIPFLSDIL